MNFDVTSSMAEARNVLSDESFQRVGSVINKVKNEVREAVQEITAPQIKSIISKLRSNKSITDDEIALIKAWMVGDAIAYTKMENNFQDWLSEFERLEKSIADYESKECSAEELLQLHGILVDAGRVNYDIAYFLENQDRIKKFENAVSGGLSERGKEFLAGMLLEKLQSPDD